MTLKEFKDQFRTICTDTWEDAIDAWFECAGRLFVRNCKIPLPWLYEPFSGNPVEENSRFYEAFADATNEELQIIGAFLFRYLVYLKRKGLDPEGFDSYFQPST